MLRIINKELNINDYRSKNIFLLFIIYDYFLYLYYHFFLEYF